MALLKIGRVAAIGFSAAALGFTCLAPAPISASPSTISGQESNHANDAGLLRKARPPTAKTLAQREPGLVAGLKHRLALPKSRSLQSDPDFWVLDAEYDSAYDSYAFPELGNSGMAVARSNPDTLITIALASPWVDSTVSRDGYVVSFLDTNNDGSSDFGSITPPQMMYQDMTYVMPVYRFVGNSAVDTGLDAWWVMTSDGWAIGYPWRSMGIVSTSFSMGLEDYYGYRDYSPDWWSTYAQFAGIVGVYSQKVSGSVPSSTRAKARKKVNLPRRTNAGKAIRWSSATKKLCTTSAATLKLTGRKGTCRITASAPGDATHHALRRNYSVRLK